MGLKHTVGLLLMQLSQAPARAQWNKPHQDSTDQKNLATHLALSVCRQDRISNWTELNWWRCLSWWTEGSLDAYLYTRVALDSCVDSIAFACMNLYMFITLLVVGYQLMASIRPASQAWRWSARTLDQASTASFCTEWNTLRSRRFNCDRRLPTTRCT